MSDEEMGKNYESGLRFMMHVFFCPSCPPVTRCADIRWFLPDRLAVNLSYRRTGGLDEVVVSDWREAGCAGVVSPSYQPDGVQMLCDEGFELAQAARGRGWGS